MSHEKDAIVCREWVDGVIGWLEGLPCLSVRWPWWEFFFAPYRGQHRKGVENRGWAPVWHGKPYRGPVLIHSPKSLDGEALDWIRAKFPGIAVPDLMRAPRQALVGVVDLTVSWSPEDYRAVYPPDPWYMEGNHAWRFAQGARFAKAVPDVKGRLGLWNVPEYRYMDVVNNGRAALAPFAARAGLEL